MDNEITATNLESVSKRKVSSPLTPKSTRKLSLKKKKIMTKNRIFKR